MTSPVPLASGRDADVFAVDGDRVLRRYRDGEVDAPFPWRTRTTWTSRCPR